MGRFITFGAIIFILLGPPAFSDEVVPQPESVRPISAKTIREFLNHQEVAYTQMRAVPSFSEGKPHGMKILSMKPDSFFRKLGLKRGDILMKVEDRPFDTKMGLEAFQALKGKTYFELEIQRGGVVQKLRLAVGESDYKGPDLWPSEAGYEKPLFARTPVKVADFSYTEDNCSDLDAPRLYGYQEEKGFGVFKIKAEANCCQKIVGEVGGASFLGEKTMTFSFKEEGEPCECLCSFNLVYRVATPKDFDFKECEILFLPRGATGADFQTLKPRGSDLNQTIPVADPKEVAMPVKASEKLYLDIDRKEITEVAKRFCEVTQRKCEVDPQVLGQITYWSSKPMSGNEALAVFSKLLAEKGYRLDISRKGILHIYSSR